MEVSALGWDMSTVHATCDTRRRLGDKCRENYGESFSEESIVCPKEPCKTNMSGCPKTFTMALGSKRQSKRCFVTTVATVYAIWGLCWPTVTFFFLIFICYGLDGMTSEGLYFRCCLWWSDVTAAGRVGNSTPNIGGWRGFLFLSAVEV